MKQNRWIKKLVGETTTKANVNLAKHLYWLISYFLKKSIIEFSDADQAQVCKSENVNKIFSFLKSAVMHDDFLRLPIWSCKFLWETVWDANLE